jgi:hypothetical protein
MSENHQKRFKIICLYIRFEGLFLHKLFCIWFSCIGYLCIINLNTIIIYAQVKFINSLTDLPFEFPRMCKNYTLKSFKTDFKKLSLLFTMKNCLEMLLFEMINPKCCRKKSWKQNLKPFQIQQNYHVNENQDKITLSEDAFFFIFH